MVKVERDLNSSPKRVVAEALRLAGDRKPYVTENIAHNKNVSELCAKFVEIMTWARGLRKSEHRQLDRLDDKRLARDLRAYITAWKLRVGGYSVPSIQRVTGRGRAVVEWLAGKTIPQSISKWSRSYRATLLKSLTLPTKLGEDCALVLGMLASSATQKNRVRRDGIVVTFTDRGVAQLFVAAADSAFGLKLKIRSVGLNSPQHCVVHVGLELSDHFLKETKQGQQFPRRFLSDPECRLGFLKGFFWHGQITPAHETGIVRIFRQNRQLLEFIRDLLAGIGVYTEIRAHSGSPNISIYSRDKIALLVSSGLIRR